MSRPPAPSVKVTLDSIRKAIGSAPMPAAEKEAHLYDAISQLRSKRVNILEDEGLLDDVLLLNKQVAAYRGKGSQAAIRSFSNLFDDLAFEAVCRVATIGTCFPSFAQARQDEPTHAATWSALEKIAIRALECIQSPPSRSRLSSGLKKDAWSHLGCISAAVCDPAWIDLALTQAGSKNLPDSDREATLDFLQEAWNDTLDENTEEKLLNLQEDPPSRSFLVGVMSLLVELDLSNEFAAMDALDNWDDAHDEGEKEIDFGQR